MDGQICLRPPVFRFTTIRFPVCHKPGCKKKDNKSRCCSKNNASAHVQWHTFLCIVFLEVVFSVYLCRQKGFPEQDTRYPGVR